MSNEKTTLFIVTITTAALFGAFFGGLSSYLLNPNNGIVEEVAQQIGVGSEVADQVDAVEDQIIKLIEEETATISVVEQVTPAVVSVLAKREFSGELIEVGGGTGFFVTSDGLVLTNKHVVDSAIGVEYSILLNDNIEYPVEIVAMDTVLDLAVLQVVFEEGETGDFPVVSLGDSDSIQNGQTVIAIGNALSEYQNSVTKGVISGTGRRVVAGTYYSTEVIEDAIQTDAAINPGNSGGPLINLLGQVIGVNTAISSTGEGVGFAIPINSAKKVVDDVIEYGHIVRPWLGVRYIMIDQYIAEENDLSSDHGALVVSGQGLSSYAVIPGSPADLAGIEESDIIVMIDGVEINIDNPLPDQINLYEPDAVVEITVDRFGQELVFQATLAEYDASIFE